MNPIQARLKSDPFPTVFEIAAKTFKSISIGYFLYTLLLMSVLIPFLVLVLGVDLQDYLELMEVSDPVQRSTMAQEMFTGLEQNFGPMTMVGIVAAAIVMTILGSWFYNFCFIKVEAYVRGRELGFGEILRKSVNVNILWLAMAGIVFVFMAIIAFVLLALVVPDSGGLAFMVLLIGTLLICIILMRFMILFPAIVHGNMSVGQALIHSWKTIHFLRGLKYLGISLIVFIALIVLMLLMALLQSGLMMIPFIGFILYMVISMIWGGFISAWLTAVQSGIYFRQLPDEIRSPEMEIEDHLIT